MNTALEYIFAKDKAFAEFVSKNGKAKPLGALRVKKPVSRSKSAAAGEVAAD